MVDEAIDVFVETVCCLGFCSVVDDFEVPLAEGVDIYG